MRNAKQRNDLKLNKILTFIPLLSVFHRKINLASLYTLRSIKVTWNNKTHSEYLLASIARKVWNISVADPDLHLMGGGGGGGSFEEFQQLKENALFPKKIGPLLTRHCIWYCLILPVAFLLAKL